jgi:uncharacterized protein YjbJ (UPF0337 family)
MKKENLQRQVARLGREVAEWLAEMSEDDLKEFEGKLDQLVTRLQKEYGWTATRAKREVAAYLDDYRERTQAVVDHTLDALNARFHSRAKRKSGGWGRLLWVGFAVAAFAVAWQVIQPGGES